MTRARVLSTHLLPSVLVGVALTGCTIGEGAGSIRSDRLYLEDCWVGPFDLQPTFFGANPFRDQMMIRIQRGEKDVEVSDGVLLVVDGVSEIRSGQLGQDLPLGLPVGVSPPGLAKVTETNPAPVSLSLYLYETCNQQNGALYSVGGTINFASLFSGDPNETDANDRLTEATFQATVVNPRDFIGQSAAPDGGPPVAEYPPEKTSQLEGSFRFFFERGPPAQAFP